MHSFLWLKHAHERPPSAFSERVAGVAGGHGYKVFDVAETFWSDFSQTIDRSWRQYALVYIYICTVHVCASHSWMVIQVLELCEQIVWAWADNYNFVVFDVSSTLTKMLPNKLMGHLKKMK